MDAPRERRGHIRAEELVLRIAPVHVGNEALGEGERNVDLACAQRLGHSASTTRKVSPLHLQPVGVEEALDRRGVPRRVEMFRHAADAHSMQRVAAYAAQGLEPRHVGSHGS